MSNNSVIMVVSAPSGTGKTSICRPLLREFPALRFSVSFTTRPPRRGEADGRDYHFVTPDAFREKIQAGDFVEWAENYGHLYGTSRGVIEEIRGRGEDILLDVEPRGARALKEIYPKGVFVFVLPPDLAELQRRLWKRGDGDEEVRRWRYQKARDEIQEVFWYDYIVVNDRLEQAIERMRAIYLAEKCRRERQMGIVSPFLAE
ncbi:MAG TPA: guanylate kinase [Syntrophales bacterium]|nr:guanylate kinase [Syntrophales bacterium]HOD98613.1 guanylate kinase [Syntrophales bacterium]HOH73375.1 guanylate kinase [Syntrophales bacterium]HPN07669.1 guanylate kinase [Syntrophales bacterium]HPX80602.1 guanylate kinase [Syntrophales bacterium]